MMAAEIVTEIIVAVILAVLSFLGGILARSVKKTRIRQKAIEGGLKALLRDGIIRECERCLDRGYMHIHNLESVEGMSNMYYTLDGNGAVKKLVQDFKRLDVK